jgi:Ca-activated chloride channel homolog
MSNHGRTCFAASVGLLGCLSFAAAQSSLRLRVDTSLVLIPVTVTDRWGATIHGLGQDSFTVLDDGLPQPITVFYKEDAPVSVGLVVDFSGSIKDSIGLERAAAKAVLDQSNADDDFSLVTFSSLPGRQTAHSDDIREITDRLRPGKSAGATALYDTIQLALLHRRLQEGKRHALLVISDGMDNNSRYSKSEVIRAALESGAQIYTLAVGGPKAGMGALELGEIGRGLAFLDDLALNSGGLSVRLLDSENPSAAAARISRALHDQYVLGYRTQDSGSPGQWHRVQVKVNVPKANVHARNAYRSQ